MIPVLTYRIAMAAAQDAGCRNMRKHGRSKWNESDMQVAVELLRKLLKQGPVN